MARSDRTVHVPRALFEDLKELARAESVSVSALVRRELGRVVRESRRTVRGSLTLPVDRANPLDWPACPVCDAPAFEVNAYPPDVLTDPTGAAIRSYASARRPFLKCERGHEYAMPEGAAA